MPRRTASHVLTCPFTSRSLSPTSPTCLRTQASSSVARSRLRRHAAGPSRPYSRCVDAGVFRDLRRSAVVARRTHHAGRTVGSRPAGVRTAVGYSSHGLAATVRQAGSTAIARDSTVPIVPQCDHGLAGRPRLGDPAVDTRGSRATRARRCRSRVRPRAPTLGSEVETDGPMRITHEERRNAVVRRGVALTVSDTSPRVRTRSSPRCRSCPADNPMRFHMRTCSGWRMRRPSRIDHRTPQRHRNRWASRMRCRRRDRCTPRRSRRSRRACSRSSARHPRCSPAKARPCRTDVRNPLRVAAGSSFRGSRP